MKTTLAKRSRLTSTMAAVAGRAPTVILAIILLGVVASPARADCNPADRIDARCYPDLQSATAAALAADVPLWLPAGTYTLPNTLFIDYTPLANTGFTVISDGAILDARASHQPAVEVQCQRDCFYFHLSGTLTVWADVADVAFQVGQLDYRDPQNSIKIDHLIVNNASPNGEAVRLNYVLNADISVYAVSAGWVGLWLRQTQFSTIRGAMTGEAWAGIWMSDGYSFANTFSGIDVEASVVGLAVWSPYAKRNTFVSPYFNCQIPIQGWAGDSNMLLNASYGAAQPPVPGSQTGILTLP